MNEATSGLPSLSDVLIAAESSAVYQVLIEGEEVSQVMPGSKSKMRPMYMQLSDDCLSLLLYKAKSSTSGPKKSSSKKEKPRGKPTTIIDVSRIEEVRTGFLTKELLYHREKLELKEENVFSLIVIDSATSKPLVYDFHLSNQLMLEWWSHSLQTLVKVTTKHAGTAFFMLLK